MPVLNRIETIDAKLATFVTSRDALASLGHEIAMLIFDETFDHDNCDRALKLAEAMPKSWKAQLVAWFKTYTPVLIVTGDSSKVGLNAKFKAERKVDKAKAMLTWFNREAALANPFYTFVEPEAAKPTMDFAALVKLVKDVSKRIQKVVDEGRVPEGDKASAARIISTIDALEIKPVVVRAAKSADVKPKAKAAKVLAPPTPTLVAA